MLRSQRETWHGHGKAEGKHLSSDSLSLHDFVVMSNNLYRLLNRLTTAGFYFAFKQTSRLLVEASPVSSKIGSYWQSFIWLWHFSGAVMGMALEFNGYSPHA